MKLYARKWLAIGTLALAWVSLPAPAADPTPTPSPSGTASKKPTEKAKPHASKAPKKPARGPSKLPPLLAEVEQKYAKAATLTAEFSQVNETSALGQKKTSTGRIYFKRPQKIRWETLSPDPNILVGDGKTFSFYTPPFDEDEHGQLIVRKASQVQSKLAHALLSGSFSVAKDMKITQKAPNLFVLDPKRGSAGTVRKAEVEVDPAQKLITRVTLHHQGGNNAEITLSKIELGKELGEDLFHFDPPPGTDRVKE